MNQTHGDSKYAMLEGIRGICAILVATRHIQGFGWMSGGLQTYLGVDMFFLLSGFVISHAYLQRLASGQVSVGGFLVYRFIRVYPLYLICLAPAVIHAALTFAPTPDKLLAVTGAALIFEDAQGRYLNGPGWSLFYELLACAIFAPLAALGKLQWSFPIALIGVFALIALGLQSDHGIEGGYRDGEFMIGTARVCATFFAGAAIQLLVRPQTRPPLGGNKSACVLLAILIAIHVFPQPEQPMIYDLAMVALAFPLLMVFAMRIATSGAFTRVMNILGEISFPLYVCHWPLAALTTYLMSHFFNIKMNASAPLSGLIVLCCLCALSYWLHHRVDVPLRKWLMSGIRKHAPFSLGGAVRRGVTKSEMA